MLFRRLSLPLVVAVALGGALRMWERSETLRWNAAAPGFSTTARETSAATTAKPPRATAGAITAAAQPAMSMDATTALAEQVVLQQFAGADEVPLTAVQWAAFADISAHYQAVRQAYEATLANVTAVAAGHVRMEIPAYPSAGDALRARFYSELRDKLGATVADEIAQRLGSALEGHFGGFGVSVQTLDFVAAAGAADNDYQVTRTVKYWNSLAAGDRLVTRRETHFPGLEDPSGHRWGPFLSVLAPRGVEKAGS